MVLCPLEGAPLRLAEGYNALQSFRAGDAQVTWRLEPPFGVGAELAVEVRANTGATVPSCEDPPQESTTARVPVELPAELLLESPSYT